MYSKSPILKGELVSSNLVATKSDVTPTSCISCLVMSLCYRNICSNTCNHDPILYRNLKTVCGQYQ